MFWLLLFFGALAGFYGWYRLIDWLDKKAAQFRVNKRAQRHFDETRRFRNSIR